MSPFLISCLTFSYLRPEAEQAVKTAYSDAEISFFDIRKLVFDPQSLMRYFALRTDCCIAYVPDARSGDALDAIGMLLVFSRAKERFLLDTSGYKQKVMKTDGIRFVFNVFLDVVSMPVIFLLARLRSLSLGTMKKGSPRLMKSHDVLYLRTDPGKELRAGGSVAHTAGVIKGFIASGYQPEYAGSIRMKAVEDTGIPIHYVDRRRWLRNIRELSFVGYAEILNSFLRQCHRGRHPGMIYQRYSMFNYTGALLSGKFKVPFVLEYNGSDVWVAKNWGTPLIFEKLADRIEIANLKAADIIVVVSKPLKDELINRGIDTDKILVNPNGVDAERYRPDIDGNRTRKKLGLEERLVAGFIGTFGRWHGAEVLAAAVKDIVKAYGNLHFLFIGDGMTMPLVKEIISSDNMEKHVTFTGLIPQNDAPEYLAACDMLISPHVRNPDGTPFFGSPTKLFEYMAMGKPIVASNLDQIGEVLAHGKTAWLVTPGDADDLSKGIIRLAEDKRLMAQLGRNAREEVVVKYTWTEHVRKIVDALEAILDKRSKKLI